MSRPKWCYWRTEVGATGGLSGATGGLKLVRSKEAEVRAVMASKM